MGQVKNRGTKEQRIKEAQKKRLEAQGIVEKSMEELYKEFDIPDDAEFLGYVVNAVEKDEYIAHFEDTPDVRNIAYSKTPEFSLKFENFEEALEVGKVVAEKYKTDICLLFETKKEFRVFPTYTVDLKNYYH
ncbi:hypothetical protein [Psychrobacter sp. I-STPA6b]|uniref:hypothetical protein n=1 Tax=Psychrobacter sp. I-STPA6b TaxID=2585718 RepID=UPI001D0C70C7|nr:hypothetical protein [Psychrobacter sp. I-STPA6b]